MANETFMRNRTLTRSVVKRVSSSDNSEGMSLVHGRFGSEMYNYVYIYIYIERERL